MHDSDLDDSFYYWLGVVGLIILGALVAFLTITFSNWLSDVIGYEVSLNHTPLAYLVLITIFFNAVTSITNRK